MNWKQPKQLSKTTLPFGRSLNGHGRSGKTGLTSFATSHIPVTSVVIPTASKSLGQRSATTSTRSAP